MKDIPATIQVVNDQRHVRDDAGRPSREIVWREPISAQHIVAVDAFAIAKEKTWCFLVPAGVDDLLRSPLGVGIRSDVEMNDLSPIVPEHDENVQHPKCSRRHGKEIARDDVWNVIIEERSPSLRRRLTGAPWQAPIAS